MARREWAEQWAFDASEGDTAQIRMTVAAKRLQAEHARAVRIVKVTRKRVAQDTATYNDVERIIIDVVLQGLMDDLQKGRA